MKRQNKSGFTLIGALLAVGRKLAGQRPSRRAGFALLETLVASGVLMVGFLALAMLHIGACRAISLSRNHTLATILAYEQIERLQRLGYDSVQATTDIATADGRSFGRSWTSTANPGASKTVEVSINWRDQWGEHELTIPAVVRQ